MEMFKVLEVSEAVDILKKIKIQRRTETIFLKDSLRREVSTTILSKENVPYFRKSMVDGYALDINEIQGAGDGSPIILEIAEEINVGTKPKPVEIGKCSYVPTGGMIPEKCNGVIMIEDTEKISDNEIIVLADISMNANIIEIGEDLKINDEIILPGEKITPYHLALLGAVGILEINVYKKIRIGILSTGDEIINIDEKQIDGKIRDVNKNLLTSLLIEDGAEITDYGIVNDSLEKLIKKIDEAKKNCDIIIISGGTSVGKKDHTINAITSFENGDILVHGIALKPGKPTIIATIDETIIIGLPGNPQAVVSSYINIVRPKICKEKKTGFIAKIDSNYHSAKGRQEFLPVKCFNKNGELYVKPILSKSTALYPLIKASGYVTIDRDLEGINENDVVTVFNI